MWTLETSMTQRQEFLQPPKVALALDRYLRGLEVQGMHLVGVLANPKDPQTWKVGHDVTGWGRLPPRWHWCWGLSLWEDGQCGRVETFHCHLGLSP